MPRSGAARHGNGFLSHHTSLVCVTNREVPASPPKPAQIESHTPQRFSGIYAGVQFTHYIATCKDSFQSCLGLPVIATLVWMFSIEYLDRV